MFSAPGTGQLQVIQVVSKKVKGCVTERMTTPTTFSEQPQSPGRTGSFERGGSVSARSPSTVLQVYGCDHRWTGRRLQSLLLHLPVQFPPLPGVLWETSIQHVFSRTGHPGESALGKLPGKRHIQKQPRQYRDPLRTGSACPSENTH